MSSSARPAFPLRGDHANIGEALAAAASQFPDREAYVAGSERMTFAQWNERADIVAAGLRSIGVEAGDVVAILLPSSLEFAVCYAAGLRLGAIVTALSTRMGAAELRAVLVTAEAKVVVCDDEESRLEVGTPRVAPATLRDSAGAGDFATSVGLDDTALIIWTSGTTGLPKGATYAHRQLRAAAYSAGVMSAPYDRRLIATPFSHAGYLAKIWDQLAWGITFVIAPVPWNARTTADVLTSERVTVASAVPTQWAKLLELSAGDEHLTFPDLRLATAATAPAPPAMVRAVSQRFGVPLVVRYAMSESPSISGTDPDDDPDLQFETVGRAQAGMEISIRNDAGAPIAAGFVGRIWVRGDCVMRGYWGDAAATADAIDSDGWLTTGDLGRLTDAGYLVLTGRSSEMYIRGGYNVYPLEVERALSHLDSIAQVAIIGWPTPVIGEIGIAFVVSSDPELPPTLDQVRAWLAGQLADYKAPDALIIVEQLPVTAMLKVDKNALRAGLESGSYAVPERRVAR